MKVPKNLIFKTDGVTKAKKDDRPPTPKPDITPSGGGQKDPEKAPDGRQVAKQNERTILRVIERMGHATSWQIAKMSGLSRRSAQRTIKRLQQQKMLSSMRLPDGNPVYVMRQGGADDLAIALQREVKRTNDDQSFVRSRLWRHRKLANDTAAELAAQGFQVYTEREIQRGLTPAGRREVMPGKVPDLLFDQGDGWSWVEVERAFKKRSEYQHMVKTLETITKRRGSNNAVMIGDKPIWEVVILVDEIESARKHVTRFLKHFNRADLDTVPDHLLPIFTAISLMWWEGAYLRTDPLLHFPL